MAKRFTDTEKWNKKFVRNLPPEYKLLWLFLLDECNTAGIWDVDIDVAQLKLGVILNEAQAKEFFGNKITPIDDGAKWFVPAFIEFQYGSLSETNRAHTKAIFALKKFGLLDEKLKIKQAPYKPLTSPLQGAMVEVEEEVVDMVEEEVVVKDSAKNKNLVYPFDGDLFLSIWNNWKVYKKTEFNFKYKSVHTEQAALHELARLSNYNLNTAITIIGKSMSNGWKGLFELKDEDHGKPGTTKTGSTLNATAKQRVGKYFGQLPGNGSHDGA